MEPIMKERRSSFQEIHCTGQNSSFSFPVYEKEVVVNAGQIDLTENITASNKVKVSQIAKTEWEEKCYHGNLVSCNSSFVAYIIKGKGDKDDHVRVINHHTSTRALLRGTKKKIVEVCFESYKSNYLSCIDSEGSLYIFEIIEEDGIIKGNLILHIKRRNIENNEKQRVIWAPNLIAPMDTHNSIISVSFGSHAEVFDLKKILDNYEGPVLDRDAINVGVVSVKDCHTKDITCLALSPDTNVLATCSLDGDVKFWSLDFSSDGKAPSNLHEWEPHDGEPVTYLSFCDNLLVGDDSIPFWRYLITGTSMNSVIKIWCAVKWECLQTIEFTPYTDQNPTSSPCMKLALDISAKFLVLSDIYRPILYICHLNTNELKKISITSLSEFVLKEPLLSFTIYAARDRKNQLCETDNDELINGGDGDIFNGVEEVEFKGERQFSTNVTLFAVHKRAIQKYFIKYAANTSVILPPPSISTTESSQEDLMSLRDPLSDVDSIDNFSDKQQVQEAKNLKKFDDISSLAIDESIDTSITSISPMTLNGTRAESFEECSLIDIQPPSYNSMISNVDGTHLFSDTFENRTENFNSDFIASVTEPLVNGLTSLSVDSNQSIPVSTLCEANDIPIKNCRDDVHSADKVNVTEEVLPPSTYEILTLLNNQQQELEEMKDMMKQFLNNQKECIANGIESNENERDDIKVSMQLLQKSATSHFSKATKEFNKLCSDRLEKFTANLNLQAQQREERNLQVLSNIVSNTIAIKLEKTIKQEMKQTVLTSLEKITSKYMENINIQIAQKLSGWERVLREETHDLIKSKTLADSIGTAAGNFLRDAIPSAFNECIKNILLPGFEKTLMAIFMQIDQTFRQGTKQHMEGFSKMFEAKQQKQKDSPDPLILHLQDLIQSFQATADRLTSGVETNLEALMQKQLSDALDRMQTDFTTAFESRVVPALSQSISNCISAGIEGKITQSLSSMFQSGNYNALSTEKSSNDRKERILAFVEEGDYNKAFEEALTAADLSLVMFLCKQVDPGELFRKSQGSLQQNIILSLIQQLSVNLAEETETKRRYLEESIIALDRYDEITREHLPAVLQGLNDQLKQAIDSLILTDSTNIELKPLKMLLMASRSLLHDV